MAQWKKVIVSGSSVSQLTNDANYLINAQAGAALTGSFTGSFKGDGSNLTGLTADSVAFANITGKPTLVSGSAQVDITGTTGYGTFSSSLATDIASNLSAIQSNDSDITVLNTSASLLQSQIDNLDGDYATDAELNASSSALTAAYTAADSALSSSLAVDIATNTAAIAGLDSTYATDAQLDAVSSSLAADISSISTDFADIQNKPTLVSGSAQVTITDTTGYGTFSSSLATDIASNLSAIQSNDGDITALQNDSGSFSTRVTAVEGQITALGDTYATDAELNASSSALTAAYTTADTNLSSSLATDIAQNKADITTNASDITALETFQTEVENSLTFDGTNTTVAGNLTVNGTASFGVIQSITGSAKIIGDAYVLLNANSPTQRYTGIKVIDSGSTDTGSLEYDSVNNHWFYESTNEGYASAFLAGPRASRGNLQSISKYTVPVGDGGNHLTGSSIIDSGSTVRVAKNLNVTGSIELSGTVDGIDLQAHSGSVANRFDAIESDITALGDTYATDAELNASSSALTSAYTTADTAISTSLAADIATNTAAIANLDSTYATDSQLDAVSSSFATTIDGLTSDYTELTNIPNGIISSSAQTVASLVNQEVNLGTAAITASYFLGDGSRLTNITVDQSSTVIEDFTSQTSVTVTHNFNSLNVLATVYDNNNYHILPASTQTVNSNQVTVTFDVPTTGRIIVGKGGHIVSGSIPFANLINKPTVVSGSAQIDIASTTGYSTFSSSIASNIATNAAAIANLDNTYATDTALDNVSSSFASTIAGLTSDYTELTNIPNGIVSSSAQLASDISGSFVATSASLAADIAQNATDIANISTDFDDITNKPTLISGSTYSSPSQGTLRATINGVNSDIDLGLQSSDSPTFTNLTVSGDLTVTGNTFEAQVTNLNVEDRFILLNSGSNTGDSGIIFGGSDGTAGEGSGLFFDNPAGVFGFSQGIGATDTSATHTSKIGNIETAAAAPSGAPTFQGTGTIHIDSSNGDIYIYTD